MQEFGVQFMATSGISGTLRLSAGSQDTPQHYWQEKNYFALLLCHIFFETSGVMEMNQRQANVLGISLTTPGQVLTVRMLCAAMVRLTQVNNSFAHTHMGMYLRA